MANYFEYVLLTIALTYIYMEVSISMQQRSSSEADSSSASQEIPCLLLNPRFISVHNLPLVPIISQKNPVHTLPSYFFQIHFSIILPLMPRSSKCSFSLSHMLLDPPFHPPFFLSKADILSSAPCSFNTISLRNWPEIRINSFNVPSVLFCLSINKMKLERLVDSRNELHVPSNAVYATYVFLFILKILSLFCILIFY